MPKRQNFTVSSPDPPSALMLFLTPLLRRLLSLVGGGSDTDVPFRAEHSTVQLFCVVLYVANGFVIDILLLLNLKLNWYLLGTAGTQRFCPSSVRGFYYVCDVVLAIS